MRLAMSRPGEVMPNPANLRFARFGELLKIMRWHGGKLGLFSVARGIPVRLESGREVDLEKPFFFPFFAVYEEPETTDPILASVFRCNDGRRTVSLHELAQQVQWLRVGCLRA